MGLAVLNAIVASGKHSTVLLSRDTKPRLTTDGVDIVDVRNISKDAQLSLIQELSAKCVEVRIVDYASRGIPCTGAP